MRIKQIILTLILVFSSIHFSAQDTLLLLTGRTMVGQVNPESGVDILFDVQKKNGKQRTLRYERLDIYSMTQNGEQSILYRKDSLMGFDLSPIDMRYYMHGQNDARYGYNSKPTMYLGFALGCGAAVAANGDVRGLAMPLVYSLAMQIPYIHIDDKAITDKRNTISPYYVEGFNKTARSKKFVNGFLASFAGVLTGSVVMALADG